jgi:hypothetical protein
MNLIINNRAGVQLAAAEKGRLFVEEAVRRTVEYLKKIMGGEIGMPEWTTTDRQLRREGVWRAYLLSLWQEIGQGR